MSAFDSFGLDPRLVSAVTSLGFTEPTPIQSEAMPALLAGRNVIGGARTGSGKTAAYGLPLLQRIQGSGRGLRALVLTPTRELALQVSQDIRRYGADLGVEVIPIYGGAAYGPQFKALQTGVPVVVGTPGRVIDHIERGSMKLQDLQVLVLDEADEMLRMGFLEEVERILSATPPTAQRALFSATMPDPIRRVAQTFLTDPLEIQVERSALMVDHIQQRYVLVPREHKIDALIRLLRGEPRGTTLVFSRTRSGCAEVADELSHRGLDVDALHGELNQAAREYVLRRLRTRRIDVLIATDVAARGIDVEHITHVINMELPTDIESYVHRIGRTGRAGRVGTALSLVTTRDMNRVRGLEKALKVRIEEAKVPSDADISRRRRASLFDELREISAEDIAKARARLDSPEATGDLAAAALAIFARERTVELGPDPDDAPPPWMRVAPKPPRRNERNMEGRPNDFRPNDGRPNEGRPNDFRPNEGPPNESRPNEGRPNDGRLPDARPQAGRPMDNRMVELFFPIGSGRGVRPGDIVGALTNEVGMPPDQIGKVRIFERKCFVGVPKYAADLILQRHPSIALRGVMVPVSLARPDPPWHDAPKSSKKGR